MFRIMTSALFVERGGDFVMKCVICGKEIDDYGNDPWPFCIDEGARCCDECNAKHILPVRLAMLLKRDKEERDDYNN